MRIFLAAFLLFTSVSFAGPTKLLLKNQFGEQSNNYVIGSVMPIVAGSYNAVSLTGSGAPVDATTGANIADKGSLYFRQSSGAIYSNTGTKASPVWSALGTTTNAAVIASTLTAFSAGAGTVTSSDTILSAAQKFQGNDTQLKNGTFTPAPETVSAAGAISTSLMESNLANATGGDLAMTLAAPSSQDGQLKILKMTVRTTNNVTVAMTNIAMSGGYTPTGTTTLTFSAVGQSAVFMAVGSKWVYLGGSAVAS